MLGMMSRNRVGVSLLFVAITLPASGQQPQADPAAGQTSQAPARTAGANQAPPAAELTGQQVDQNYALGPNDQILIRAPGADDINERPFRIDSEGFINLPSLGRLRAAGLTTRQLEAEIVNRLRGPLFNPR